VIASNSEPRNRPAPRKSARKLRFGVLKGKLRYPDDFDTPLPAQILALFEGQQRK